MGKKYITEAMQRPVGRHWHIKYATNLLEYKQQADQRDIYFAKLKNFGKSSF